MTEVIEYLTTYSQSAWVAIFLVFLRVGAVMAVLPVFGERSVPNNVRLVLTLAFTAIVFPAAPIDTRVFSDMSSIIGLPLLSEVIAGLAIGLLIRLAVMVLQIAGTIISQSTSLSQLFGGGAVDAQPAMGYLLFTAGLALAATLGLHERVVYFILDSYTYMPAGQLPSASDLSPLMIGHVSKSFAMAFSFAAPFLIASMIYNSALGIINRAMPQLMVAFVGAPAITLGGIMLLFLTAPLLLEIWIKYFHGVMNSPLGSF